MGFMTVHLVRGEVKIHGRIGSDAFSRDGGDCWVAASGLSLTLAAAEDRDGTMRDTVFFAVLLFLTLEHSSAPATSM